MQARTAMGAWGCSSICVSISPASITNVCALGAAVGSIRMGGGETTGVGESGDAPSGDSARCPFSAARLASSSALAALAAAFRSRRRARGELGRAGLDEGESPAPSASPASLSFVLRRRKSPLRRLPLLLALPRPLRLSFPPGDVGDSGGESAAADAAAAAAASLTSAAVSGGGAAAAFFLLEPPKSRRRRRWPLSLSPAATAAACCSSSLSDCAAPACSGASGASGASGSGSGSGSGGGAFRGAGFGRMGGVFASSSSSGGRGGGRSGGASRRGSLASAAAACAARELWAGAKGGRLVRRGMRDGDCGCV